MCSRTSRGASRRKQALRLAAAAGHAEASLLLGALLTDERGREDEAREAYRAAIDADLEVGWCGLAELLDGDARREALERCPLSWWNT